VVISVVVEVVAVVVVEVVVVVVVAVISVVVEVISVVVEVISVVLDTTSSIQRLSPEMQSSQDSSMDGQFSKRTHTGTKVLKVNQRHPHVESQSWRQSFAVCISSECIFIPLQLPWIEQAFPLGMQSC
jgi:hypothetical protein